MMTLVKLEDVKALVSREMMFGMVSAFTLPFELDKLPRFETGTLTARVVTDKMDESLFGNEMERDAYIKREQAMRLAKLLVGDGILVRSKQEVGIFGCTEYRALLTVVLPKEERDENNA